MTTSIEKAVILLVDDKPANIVALEALLAGPERIILTANSGQEALKVALEKKPDLIMLDVQMPDMDGFEVASILQSNRKTREIPIIFASAEKKEHASIIKGFGEGAADYLFKPLDPDLTRAKVSVLLKLHMQKKELIEKNALLEKSAVLINNSADIIGVIDTATLKIEEINRAFTIVSGYSHEETCGTSLLFFLDAADRTKVEELGASPNEKLSFETRIACKDGSTRWLDWNAVVKGGKWFVNARDITEIRQVERIRNYLATVVKQSNDSIYIHDHEGNIISWNQGAERIYGYGEGEALQMKIWALIPDQLQHETEAIVRRILNGDRIEFMESKRLTKQGQLVDVLFSASLIADTGSTHQSIVITERDITRQKAADQQIHQLNASLQKNIQQLQATNRELESFSYSVSHDLRAPLRALNGNARILEEDFGSGLDDEAKQILAKITSNVTRMDGLINDLLSFSKVGKKEVRKSYVNMEDIVRDVLSETANSTAIKAKVIIHKMPEAFGDYSMLNQVWTNLISNALKYSAKTEHPEIEVGFTDNPAEGEYYIKDNGAGFDMAYAGKLFGTFQRLHDSSEFEGTGIGLAIVHRIITKHGGTIRAHAEAGKGATFWFRIPPESEAMG